MSTATTLATDERLESVLADLLGALELPRPTVRFTYPDDEADAAAASGQASVAGEVLTPAELPAGRRACGLRPEEVSQLALQMERLSSPLARRELPPPTGRAEPWWLRLARRTA
jgi:hypothetical protein